jgi:catechol 2,3-dioxygenase-like lactoylglutathione lyase family enzyme
VETVINDMLGRFERGTLSRRQLIQGLSLLAAAATPAAALAQDGGVKATSLNHLGIVVSNLQRSVDFYQKMLGLTVVSQEPASKIARLGQKGTLISLREAAPVGVDHYALSIEGFDRDLVTKRLTQLGVAPQQDTDSGFHVKDPDGVNVQLV